MGLLLSLGSARLLSRMQKTVLQSDNTARHSRELLGHSSAGMSGVVTTQAQLAVFQMWQRVLFPAGASAKPAPKLWVCAKRETKQQHRNSRQLPGSN